MSEKQSPQPKHTRTVLRDLFASERSFPLLSASLFFILWFCFFQLTSVFLNTKTCFASEEIAALSVFRYKLFHADFSNYSFQFGLGTNLPRIALRGFGGLLTIPFSLLPESVFPQAILVLSALRLGLSAFFFSKLLSLFLQKNTLLRHLFFSLLYTIAVFSISYILLFPVSGVYAMLPLSLFLVQKAFREPRCPFISISLLLSLCLYLVSNIILALILLPVLICASLYLITRRKDNNLSQTLLRLMAHILLSVSVCGFITIPAFMQIPSLMEKQDRTSSFLQKIGSDTSSHKTDMTIESPITDLLYGHGGSMVLTGHNAANFSTETPYTDHFALLNEWIYSLWPYLPSVPFQTSTTASTTPEFTSAGSVRFTVSTLFSDPLYAAITLPNRSHRVDVFLNDNPIDSIYFNSGTVLIRLGTFNAGQLLTLDLKSDHPSDLKEVNVRFGYLNSFDWNRYTESANFGVLEQELSQDGLSAVVLAASDSLILTNIPYEKGWTVYLNGIRSDISSYENAFICVPVSAGNYQVFFHYQAPGFFIGGILSAVSFLFLAIYFFSKSSPKKSSIKSQKIESK